MTGPQRHLHMQRLSSSLSDLFHRVITQKTNLMTFYTASLFRFQNVFKINIFPLRTHHGIPLIPVFRATVYDVTNDEQVADRSNLITDKFVFKS